METRIETNSKAGHKSHDPTDLVLSLTFPTIQARLTGPLPPPLKSSSEGSKNKVLEQNQIGGDHCGRGHGGEVGVGFLFLAASGKQVPLASQPAVLEY